MIFWCFFVFKLIVFKLIIGDEKRKPCRGKRFIISGVVDPNSLFQIIMNFLSCVNFIRSCRNRISRWASLLNLQSC